MQRAFRTDISINQFSDLLELDFESIFSGVRENMILICTPEKLQYIFHHQPGYLSEVDMFVFDEGHLFDDASRGALYELLVADIKNNLRSNQQMIFMSAVLSNADRIMEWSFENRGILAYDDNIKSTPKVVGFTSDQNEIHYFSDTFSEEDYYIPRAINVSVLSLKGKERKERVFPEADARDIAIYYAKQLCKNGGVAIYFNQRRSISKSLERCLEIEDRDYDLTTMKESADQDEIKRLYKLIVEYYGVDHVYSKAAILGILPHYSSLPNGLRMSIEYAFRKGKIKVVACTSTLAQGVNIPIKYLLMTTLRSAQKMITTRDFQNLIGRTARSGVYTEGSVIITDPNIYDNRGYGKGYFDWQNALKLFDSRNSEACGSAILSVVQNISITHNCDVLGDYVAGFICNHYTEKWDAMLIREIGEIISKERPDINLDLCKQIITDKIGKYKNITGTIETEICYLLVKEDLDGDYESIKASADKIYQSSLAFFLANEEEKQRLQNIFCVIVESVYANKESIQKYASAMVSIDTAELITRWIAEYDIENQIYAEYPLLEMIIELYNSANDDNVQVSMCVDWIAGKNYEEISIEYDIQVLEVEKICGYTYSYNLNFLIANIIDFMSSESVNLNTCMLLQKKTKYGVDTQTALSICEKVFNERYLARLMTDIIGDKSIGEDKIEKVIKAKKEQIETILRDYPSYFLNRVSYIK